MITLHIPTEQYGYCEVQVDSNEPHVAVETYKEYSEAFKVKEGISRELFRTALDRYLTDGTGETALFLEMNPEQQKVFQEIKLAYKRIEAKNGKLKTNE